MSMPPAELWVQYSVIGILILVLFIFGMGARATWREITTWLSKQQKSYEDRIEKRETDYQNSLADRDSLWRKYFENLERSQAIRADGTNRFLERLARTMEGMSEKMDLVHRDVRQHDGWAREAMQGAVEELSAKDKT